MTIKKQNKASKQASCAAFSWTSFYVLAQVGDTHAGLGSSYPSEFPLEMPSQIPGEISLSADSRTNKMIKIKHNRY